MDVNEKLAKTILSRLTEIEAHNQIISNLASQLKKDLECFNIPAPKRGSKLSDKEKALIKRKIRKSMLGK